MCEITILNRKFEFLTHISKTSSSNFLLRIVMWHILLSRIEQKKPTYRKVDFHIINTRLILATLR